MNPIFKTIIYDCFKKCICWQVKNGFVGNLKPSLVNFSNEFSSKIFKIFSINVQQLVFSSKAQKGTRGF